MDRLFVGLLMLLTLGCLLMLLTQVDECGAFGGGGCSQRSSNTYDQFYGR